MNVWMCVRVFVGIEWMCVRVFVGIECCQIQELTGRHVNVCAGVCT